MNRCLSNTALYHFYAGDGNTAQQLHLDTCASCAKRYEQLSQRLSAVEQTLRRSPPRLYAHEAPIRGRYRYGFPVAATALAVALVLVWGKLWQKEPASGTAPQASRQEIDRFLATEIPSALFATIDVAELRPPHPVSDTAYVEAALTDDWPCEQLKEGQPIECDIHPFPLLIEDY
jgi:hypothetical protein